MTGTCAAGSQSGTTATTCQFTITYGSGATTLTAGSVVTLAFSNNPAYYSNIFNDPGFYLLLDAVIASVDGSHNATVMGVINTGSGCQITTTVGSSHVSTVALAQAGAGYAVNQVVYLPFLGSDSGTMATVTITSVGASGNVTGISLTSNGSGYTVAGTATVQGPAGLAGNLCTLLGMNGSGGLATVFANPNNNATVNLYLAPTASGAVCVGNYAGQMNGASQIVMIGNSAGLASTGDDNVIIGSYAGKNNTTGGTNISIGSYAGANNLAGTNNVYIGSSTGYATGYVGAGNASYNVCIGHGTGQNLTGTGTSGANNVFIGNSVAVAATTAHDNVIIGQLALPATNSSNLFLVGNSNWYGGVNADGYFGNGVTAHLPCSFTLHATGAGTAYTDQYGGNFTLAAGIGTGAGVPGYLAFKTSTAIGSGTTAQTLTTRWSIVGSGLVSGTDGTVANPITTAGTATVGGLVIPVSSPPSSAGATGTTGQIAWDATYLYVCMATNTWKRAALSSW